MTEQQDLLFELGCEELPPKNLLTLSNALLANIQSGLDEVGLTYQEGKAYATPRRLAVLIKGLKSTQADKVVEKRGPAVKAAFAEDGSPSRAALGFAKSCGAEFEALERMKTDKGEWLIFKQAIKGKTSTELVPDIIHKSIHDLPIAKKMRWGNSDTEFVRPVKWVVLLYGEKTVDATILELKAGNQTQGHRFHAPAPFTIKTPSTYLESLRTQGNVIADFHERKALIKNAAHEAAKKVGGLAHIEEDLLNEITALNEQPVPVIGNFDERFLALPKEVLITTMQSNQKYFPIVNESGDLLAHFITFSNIKSTRPESIQKGNERVILPRLADAEFFWNQDRKKSLSDRVDSLNSIIFQQKLGTIADKTKRLQALADVIATELNADKTLANRAALLAKTDLMTDMVGEFASLQGVVGRYYALADNEPVEVAQALEEQYFPKQSGTATPQTITGQILSLADKLDTLTGIFSAGLIPTGDKDPYALRRASLGILRIIIENKLSLNIVELIKTALKQYSHEFDRLKTQQLVTDFVFERLKGYCLEQGFKIDEFDAVMRIKPTHPLDFINRLQAVKRFRTLPEAASLAAANKRIGNILKKSKTKPASEVGELVETQELALLTVAKQSAIDIKPLLETHNYEAALSRLAQLKEPVDNFFDNVMVNCDDVSLRANRLALLNLLAQQFLQIADISKLQA
ncbi:MAG: glycine--tRNA ligase subunit beta [Methylococcales bacterium]|nr:glycine--tRNA ligase subunit beta [Methylococcales bacterium]